MTDNTPTPPKTIRKKLANVDLPEFGNPKHPLRLDVYDEDTDSTSTHDVWLGDVLERHNRDGIAKYYVVIDLTDEDVIYYTPGNHRFQSYPIQFLDKDVSRGSVSYHQRVIPE